MTAAESSSHLLKAGADMYMCNASELLSTGNSPRELANSISKKVLTKSKRKTSSCAGCKSLLLASAVAPVLLPVWCWSALRACFSSCCTTMQTQNDNDDMLHKQVQVIYFYPILHPQALHSWAAAWVCIVDASAHMYAWGFLYIRPHYLWINDTIKALAYSFTTVEVRQSRSSLPSVNSCTAPCGWLKWTHLSYCSHSWGTLSQVSLVSQHI